MIDAEIRGKLGRTYARAHERAEDLLTSTAFGLLRYLPTPWGVLALVRLARRVRPDSGGVHVEHAGPWLDLPEATTCSLDFWPYAGAYGQPDILATFAQRDGVILAMVLIEVKLFSGKSPRADVALDDNLEPARIRDPDQLVRYWQWLSQTACVPEPMRAVIYLTAHAAPPVSDLQRTLERMPMMSLGWLSWRDVWRVAHDCARATGSLPAADLERLLAHKCLHDFDGFRTGTLTTFGSGSFWRSGWFGTNSLRTFDLTPRSFWQRPRWFDPEELPHAQSWRGPHFWTGARP